MKGCVSDGLMGSVESKSKGDKMHFQALLFIW